MSNIFFTNSPLNYYCMFNVEKDFKTNQALKQTRSNS